MMRMQHPENAQGDRLSLAAEKRAAGKPLRERQWNSPVTVDRAMNYLWSR